MGSESLKAGGASGFLSEMERIRLNTIAQCRTVKDAAQKLNLNEGTLYNWLADLRARLIKERGHVNACLMQSRRSPLLKKELSTRREISLEEVDKSETGEQN